MTLDREFDIILTAVQFFLKDSNEALVLDDSVNWPRLISIATVHRVTTIVYRVLKENAALPPEALDKLRHIVLSQSAVNVRSARHLLDLLQQFQEQHIQVIPFKGQILGAELYGDTTLRPSVDFDLYVPKEKLHPALQLLRDAGYNGALLEQHSISHIISRFYTIEFFHPLNRTHVDLHVDVTDGYVNHLFSSQELAATRVLPFENELIPIFNEKITLSLIAVHGAKGSWAFLSALLDLALFYKRFPDYLYSNVVVPLRDRGVLRMLSVGSCLVERFFGVRLPRTVKQNIDYKSVEISRHIAHQLYENPLKPADTGWTKVVLNLQMREKVSEKMRYLVFKSRAKKVDVYGKESGSSVVRHVKRILGAT